MKRKCRFQKLKKKKTKIEIVDTRLSLLYTKFHFLYIIKHQNINSTDVFDFDVRLDTKIKKNLYS